MENKNERFADLISAIRKTPKQPQKLSVMTYGVLFLLGLLIVSLLFFEGKTALKKPQNEKAEIVVKKDTIINVSITVFHPTTKECGKYPLLCADGYKININKPERVIGLSRDLLKQYSKTGIFDFGEAVYITIPNAPYLNNWYIIHTACANDIHNRVDILIFNPTVCDVRGCWAGTIRKHF